MLLGIRDVGCSKTWRPRGGLVEVFARLCMLYPGFHMGPRGTAEVVERKVRVTYPTPCACMGWLVSSDHVAGRSLIKPRCNCRLSLVCFSAGILKEETEWNLVCERQESSPRFVPTRFTQDNDPCNNGLTRDIRRGTRGQCIDAASQFFVPSFYVHSRNVLVGRHGDSQFQLRRGGRIPGPVRWIQRHNDARRGTAESTTDHQRLHPYTNVRFIFKHDHFSTLVFSNSIHCSIHCARVLFNIRYFVIFAICVLGNALVIVTLLQNRRMRTVTNIFLINLSVGGTFSVVSFESSQYVKYTVSHCTLHHTVHYMPLYTISHYTLDPIIHYMPLYTISHCIVHFYTTIWYFESITAEISIETCPTVCNDYGGRRFATGSVLHAVHFDR